VILVTGGAGFVGRALVDALVRRGASVRIFDLRAPAWLEASAYVPGQLEFMRGDVTFRPEVARAMEGVETVFHLGAQLLLAGGGEAMRRINVEGTRTVLEAARHAGAAKVVYTSTGMLYAVGGGPTREDDPTVPSGPYGQSKLEAEGVCHEFLAAGLDLAILRPLFVLGEGRLGLLHLLFDRVRRGRPIYLVGGGQNRFHMIGVADLAEACILASVPDRRGVFNVGVDAPSPVRVQMEALRDHAGSGSVIRPLPRALVQAATMVLGRMGLSPLEDEQRQVASQDRVLDTRRAKSELGFQPRFTDVAQLIAAYEWYLRARHMPRSYRSDWPDGGILSWKWIDRLL